MDISVSQLVLEAANVRQGEAIQDRHFTRFSGSTTQAKRIKQASESSQERARKAGSFRIVDGADDRSANNSNARVNFRLVPDENVHTQHRSNNIPALFGSKGVDVVTRGGKLAPTGPIIVKPQSHKAHSSSHQTFALPSASDKRDTDQPSGLSIRTSTGGSNRSTKSSHSPSNSTKNSTAEPTKSHRWGTGLKIGGAVAGGTAVAVGLKKGLDHYRDRNSFSGKVKKHGGKVAAGTLAALGAGVGVKALLKYLRKKKHS